MNLLIAIILGVVQGITEWLPVSSSGHLVILQLFLESENSIVYDLMVHAGTLLAVLLFFWKDIIKIIIEFFKSFKDLGNMGFKAFLKNEDRKMAVYIIIGTIPIVIVGVLFNDVVNAMFSSLSVVGAALIVTGIWLGSTKFANSKGDVTGLRALIVGLAQAVAIIPGISRSGSTIATGMLVGVDKNKAARFSFLLSIPAILGAIVFKLSSTQPQDIFTAANIAGFVTSFVVGALTIKFLLNVIQRGKFYLFSIYCISVGAIVLAYTFL